MSNKELQDEEREVLLSIYEGDPCFKDISPTVYQYKYGEDNDHRSFLLEISWSEEYPNEKPTISMDTFYNKHIAGNVKEKVIETVGSEVEQYLGAAMTYSLFEFVKEKEKELMEEQPDTVSETANAVDTLHLASEQESSRKTDKKVQLTKAQKRRQWDRVDSRGERPRGWNWVDLVKHLSQTGSKASPEPFEQAATG